MSGHTHSVVDNSFLHSSCLLYPDSDTPIDQAQAAPNGSPRQLTVWMEPKAERWAPAAGEAAPMLLLQATTSIHSLSACCSLARCTHLSKTLPSMGICGLALVHVVLVVAVHGQKCQNFLAATSDSPRRLQTVASATELSQALASELFVLKGMMCKKKKGLDQLLSSFAFMSLTLLGLDHVRARASKESQTLLGKRDELG